MRKTLKFIVATAIPFAMATFSACGGDSNPSNNEGEYIASSSSNEYSSSIEGDDTHEGSSENSHSSSSEPAETVESSAANTPGSNAESSAEKAESPATSSSNPNAESTSSSSEEDTSIPENKLSASSKDPHYTIKSDESTYDASTNTLTDLRDNQPYQTTTIVNQIWMAENLNYIYEIGSSAYYSPVWNSSDVYGYLYNWSAAVDSAGVFSDNAKGCGNGTTCEINGPVRGICPKGWHLPSLQEWETLFENVCGQDVASFNLMIADEAFWKTEVSFTDNYHFSAIPAGKMDAATGQRQNVKIDADYWTSNESGDYRAKYISLSQKSKEAVTAVDTKANGYSIRCVYDISAKDLPKQSSSSRQVSSSSEMLSSSSQESSSSIEVSSSAEQSSSSQESSSSETASSSSAKIKSPIIEDASEYDEASNTLTDRRDNRVYKTVTINEKVWMAENLKYPYLEPTSTLDSSSFCESDDNEECSMYGRSYLWSAAMDSAGIFSNGGKGCGHKVACTMEAPVRGVCPLGWHLPSIREFSEIACISEEECHVFSWFISNGWFEENSTEMETSYYWTTNTDDNNDGFIVSTKEKAYYVSIKDYGDEETDYSIETWEKQKHLFVRCLKD